MFRRTCWLIVMGAALLTPSGLVAQTQAAKAPRNYPPQLAGAAVETYKTVGPVKLNLYLFYPEGHRAEDRRPAIVFFFGGGWNSGSPGQFEQQCRHLARRGMVAVAADYRVASRHQVQAVQCVADAKSAVRYLRREASRLGIDPERLVAAGGSAGGHLAACTALITAFDEPDEDARISSVPSALALFNPAVVLAPVEGLPRPAAERVASLRERLGVEPEALSPYHHVRSGAPPTIIFHGKDDRTVPYATVERFAQAMKAAGNRCTLVGYEGQGHGFFNYGRGNNEYYEKTLQALDAFLVELGYLRPADRPASGS
jgi:acetyl esterase/lipase